MEGQAISVSRSFVMVLDGLGAGALPDAADYGDEGANTLTHVLQGQPHTLIPTLARLGLGWAAGIKHLSTGKASAAYGRSGFLSQAKDTITGHWELCGVILEQPFPTYSKGFPPDLINALSCAIGRCVLGNFACSGTEILKLLGETSRQTGQPIVYTSADSVFQMAAHEEVVSRDQLYEWCRIARTLLTGAYGVGRVIARPFRGESGNFVRTSGRKDFTLPVPGTSLIQLASEQGKPVHAIGKVQDIFSGQGIDYHWPAGGNEGIMEAFDVLQTKTGDGIVLGTLGDFDTLYGHRNDVVGFAQALQCFDAWLGKWLLRMQTEDILVITADHGCDPTHPTTDHTREYVPVLVYGPTVLPQCIGIRETLSDVGATIAEAMGIEGVERGTSFWGGIT